VLDWSHDFTPSVLLQGAVLNELLVFQAVDLSEELREQIM
jgi:hypothetical protein